MTTTAAELVAHAKARIENLSVTETADALEQASALLVDIREPSEREQEGYVAGAIHAPRGLLEFLADPASPKHRGEFDPRRRTILYCATGARSALAAAALQQLGYEQIAHLDGGLQAWKSSGRPIVPAC